MHTAKGWAEASEACIFKQLKEVDKEQDVNDPSLSPQKTTRMKGVLPCSFPHQFCNTNLASIVPSLLHYFKHHRCYSLAVTPCFTVSLPTAVAHLPALFLPTFLFSQYSIVRGGGFAFRNAERSPRCKFNIFTAILSAMDHAIIADTHHHHLPHSFIATIVVLCLW